MEPDYPAAHSMDTTWFAVDRDGNVAVFETGESGAAPLAAFEGGLENVAAELEPFLTREAWAYDPAPAQGVGSLESDRHCFQAPGVMGYDDVLMFLASTRPVEEDLRTGAARQVPATSGVAVLWKRLPAERYQTLHSTNACLHCRIDWQSVDQDPEIERQCGSLFRYEHLSENWVSGPYACLTQPAEPLNISQLPPDLRKRLEQCRFEEVAFREAPLLQPVEHLPCESWQDAWLAVDGRTVRPIAGKEAEYEALYREWLGSPAMQEECQMEPPPGWSPEAATDGDTSTEPPALSQNGGLLDVLRRLFKP